MWKGLLLLEKDSTNKRLFPPSHLPSDKAACNKMTQQGTPSQGFTVAISLRSTLLQCFCHKSLARHTVLTTGRYSKGEHNSEQPGHSSCRAQATQHSYMCDKVDNHCALEAEFKIHYRTWRFLLSFNQHKRNPFDSGHNSSFGGTDGHMTPQWLASFSSEESLKLRTAELPQKERPKRSY